MIRSSASGTSRSNSIAFLRLFLASIVIYSHSTDLGKFGPDILSQLSAGRWNLAGLAVDGFFFLSGLLITQSYIRLASFPRFLWHRFLRIFPGFWVCLAVTAFVFAPLVYYYENGGSLAGFLSSAHRDGPFRYVSANASLQMDQFTINGLLKYVPFPGAFDGSLWTLCSEFKCYLGVGLLGLLGVLTRARILVVLVFVFLWLANSSPDSYNQISKAPPFAALFPLHEYLDWFVYFFLGSLAYFYRDQIGLDWKLFALCVLAIPVVLSATYYELLLPFVLSYALYWLAYVLPLRDLDRKGDFSYGVYIYAFPVQQLLAFFQINRFGFWPYLILSMAFTAPLAIVSWRLIEAPALRLKNMPWPPRFGSETANRVSEQPA